MKKIEMCPVCERGTLQQKRVLHKVKVGPYTTEDSSVPKLVCDTCGEALLTGKALHGAELRAAKLVLVSKDATGSVVRDVRRILGLTQDQLAKLMDIAPESVCRIEKADTATTATNRHALLAFCERAERKQPLEGPRDEDIRIANARAV